VDNRTGCVNPIMTTAQTDARVMPVTPQTNGGQEVDMHGGVGRLVETYVARRLRAGEIGPATAKRVRHTLRAFVATIGDRPPQDIRRRHVERWQADQTKRIGSERTRRTNWSHVSVFCGWMLDRGIIDRNPMAGMRPPKERRTTPRPLTDDAVAALIASAPDARARAVLSLSICEGLRAMEIAGARIEHWDRRDGFLLVRGKGGHEREVPVSIRTASTLTSYLAELGNPSSGPLIRSSRDPLRGVKPQTISTYWARWATSAGVKRGAYDGVSCHAGRHTAATKVVDRTGDVRCAQELLGHASVATTMIYTRRAGSAKLRAAMDAA
jgi:site-specific recombinase XerC